MIDRYEKLAARLNRVTAQPRTSCLLHTPHSASAVPPTSSIPRRPRTIWQPPCSRRANLQVPYFVLGLGANILVGDKGFRGLVIRNHASHFTFSDDGKLWVESGAVVGELIPEAVERGWSGLEHYVGIPSTVGGAVWQNLHFLEPEPERKRTMFIADVFNSCDLLTEEGERKTVDADYMQFGYDTSVLHHRRDVALAVTFQLERGDTAAMHRIMQENLSWRGAQASVASVSSERGLDLQEDRGHGRRPAHRSMRAQRLSAWRCADLAYPRKHHGQPRATRQRGMFAS